jgi:hypothetical protein
VDYLGSIKPKDNDAILVEHFEKELAKLLPLEASWNGFLDQPRTLVRVRGHELFRKSDHLAVVPRLHEDCVQRV